MVPVADEPEPVAAEAAKRLHICLRYTGAVLALLRESKAMITDGAHHEVRSVGQVAPGSRGGAGRRCAHVVGLTLTDGDVYHWEVVAYDANGNRGQNIVDCVPGFKPLSLPAANPGTPGPAYRDRSYSGSISAEGGYGGCTYAIGGIYNCYGCTGVPLGNGLTVTNAQNTLNIGGTPTANGTVSFAVYVRDASADSPVGPVTYTVTITDAGLVAGSRQQSFWRARGRRTVRGND
jgi:hypothetical protein